MFYCFGQTPAPTGIFPFLNLTIISTGLYIKKTAGIIVYHLLALKTGIEKPGNAAAIRKRCIEEKKSGSVWRI
jgi:hypothetical protein